MVTLLHLSDLHFGPPYVPHVGEAVLEFAPQLDADAIVISGDLTQRAKREQFADARSFIDRLPDAPKLVIPGNHDVPLYRVGERLRDPYKWYREFISQDLDPVLRMDDAILIGLNSTSPRRAVTNGRIGEDQLDRCSDLLDGVPADTARIIVAHHHFAPAPDYLHDQTMPKSRRAIERFVDLGVELILGGHLHRAYIGSSLDFYPGNHRDQGIIIVQSGTSTSRRGRGREKEKNSFNVVQIDRDTIGVTHYIYFEQQKRFAPLSRHLFPRNGKELTGSLVEDSAENQLMTNHETESASRP